MLQQQLVIDAMCQPLLEVALQIIIKLVPLIGIQIISSMPLENERLQQSYKKYGTKNGRCIDTNTT
jgi:hypothetical protein